MIGRYLLHQFAQPHGRLGVFFAELMNRGNFLINGYAIEALQLQEGDRVLDVGFGGSAAIERLLQDGRASFVGGLDPSIEVVRRAEARLSNWIGTGRLKVQYGAVEAIPWPDASFDRLMTVNSIYYWRDPLQGARELCRILRPGGVAVIALRAKAAIDRLGLEKHGYQSFAEQEVGGLLEQAGFSAVDWHSRDDQRHGGAVMVRAERQR